MHVTHTFDDISRDNSTSTNLRSRGYKQVQMHLEDQEKTTPATFQKVIKEIFNDYIPAFMQVFLDDFIYASNLSQIQERANTNLKACTRGLPTQH